MNKCLFAHAPFISQILSIQFLSFFLILFKFWSMYKKMYVTHNKNIYISKTATYINKTHSFVLCYLFNKVILKRLIVFI